MIEKLHDELTNGLKNCDDLVKDTLNKAHHIQEKYNPFVTICDGARGEVNDNVLSGIPYVAKDNLSTKDILSTASSNTLKDYVPFFDATVVKRLKDKGAILIGKSAMDELGMGATGTTCHTGIVKNPWDHTRITAGSSAGSAALVASGVVPYALGSDTGDSVRKPAAYCGIVGYKPTYGAISRFGLFPFASSLDHVGVLTRTVRDAAIVVDNVVGVDENDMTTINLEPNLALNLNNDIKGRKIFYIKNLLDNLNNNEETNKILEEFKITIKHLEDLGCVVSGIDIDMKLLKAIFPTYVCLSCAEATSNDSNLTGIIFGPKGEGENYVDMIKDHRTKGFSSLIKRRFVIGSYVLQKENQEKYFLNAKRVRRMITEKMNDLFNEYDAMIMPASSKIAPKIENSNEKISGNEQILENLMAIGNFGGYPSITIPNGIVNEMPIGVNITGNIMKDKDVLNIAYKLESTYDYSGMIAKEVR